MSKTPPSKREERQFPPGCGPDLLGQWLLRFRKHWQATYHVAKVAQAKQPILIATPYSGLQKPPEQITFVEWDKRYSLALPLEFVKDSFEDPPPDDRFYCLATAKTGPVTGSYVGLMQPSPTTHDLPIVVVGEYGSEHGVKVRPSDL